MVYASAFSLSLVRDGAEWFESERRRVVSDAIWILRNYIPSDWYFPVYMKICDIYSRREEAVCAL